MALLSFGSCYFSTPAATSNESGVPIKAAGTTTTMQLGDFTHPASNRLTYTGTVTRTFEVRFDGTVTKGAGGSTLTEMSLYKNGAAITGASIQRQVANAADAGAFAVAGHVSLATDDYVELWCESTDSNDDITVEFGVLAVRVLG